MKNELYIVEAVSAGHPDKLCDLIAQNVLDYCLTKDREVRLACEVLINRNYILITGEIKANFLNGWRSWRLFNKDIKILAKNMIKWVGYNQRNWKNIKNIAIDVNFYEQSSEIRNLVNKKTKKYTYDDNPYLPGINKVTTFMMGDNTVVVGYATSGENAINNYPAPQFIANSIMKNLNIKRDYGETLFGKYLAPDGKILIIGKGKVIEKISLSQQSTDSYFMGALDKIHKNEFFDTLIMPVLNKYKFKLAENFKFNLTTFTVGGGAADTGLTGRKLMIDSYGTFARNGGGSMIGKDYTKPDITLALYARYIAIHLVVAGLVPSIEILISGVIGNSNIFKISSNVPDNLKAVFNKIVDKYFNLDFESIIMVLKLYKPFYTLYADYGFFGRGEDVSWETINEPLLNKIKKVINKLQK